MNQEEIEVCKKAFAFAQRNLRAKHNRRAISKVDTYEGSKPVSKPIPPYDMKQDQEAIEAFKSLQEIIPGGIIKQIEGINKPLHCIFIAGKDFDLITGVASYVYNTHAEGSFTHLSYSGHTDQEIISDLFPPTNTFKLQYYGKGRTLFISGLGSEHQLVFKRLLGVFREINPQTLRLGYLIIHVGNADILPQELANLSDVIRLEPVTQDTAKNQAIPKDIKEIHYDDSAGILFVDKIHADLTTTEKVFFECFWDSKSGIVHVDDVIDRMTTFNEFSDTSWDRGYFDTVLSNINSKGKRLMGTKLIKNVSKGRGEYSLSVKIKKKTFKP